MRIRDGAPGDKARAGAEPGALPAHRAVAGSRRSSPTAATSGGAALGLRVHPAVDHQPAGAGRGVAGRATRGRHHGGGRRPDVRRRGCGRGDVRREPDQPRGDQQPPDDDPRASASTSSPASTASPPSPGSTASRPRSASRSWAKDGDEGERRLHRRRPAVPWPGSRPAGQAGRPPPCATSYGIRRLGTDNEEHNEGIRRAQRRDGVLRRGVRRLPDAQAGHASSARARLTSSTISSSTPSGSASTGHHRTSRDSSLTA